MTRHAAQSGGWFTGRSQAALVVVSLCIGMLACGNASVQTRDSSDAAVMPRLQIQLHSGGLQSAVFSPDDRLILTASGYLAHLWDMTTGRELRRFVGHSDLVGSAIFSPDGRSILTVGQDMTARLWDTAKGGEIWRVEDHDLYALPPAAFSRDGRWILIATNDGNSRLWDAKTGRELCRFKGQNSAGTSAVFSQDSRSVLTRDYSDVRLWDTTSGRELHRFQSQGIKVTSAVFSADDRFVLTASEDQTARLWNIATGRELHSFKGHTGWVSSAVFSPDGRIVLTASADGARLWDIDTEQEVRRFEEYIKPGYSGTTAVFSSNGRWVLTASTDGIAHLWDTANGRELRRFEGYGTSVSSAGVSPDGGLVLTAGIDKTARLWDLSAGRILHHFEGHLNEVYTAIFSPNGQLVLTTSLDATARIWDAANGRELRRFEANTNVHSAAFSPDGRTVVTAGEDGTPRLWDVATGEELGRFEGHTGRIASVVFSSDGRLVLTASWDGTARLWDRATGQPLRHFDSHGSGVNSAVFSHDGRFILTASLDDSVRLWEASTGAELLRFKGHRIGVYSAVFSLDDRLVLSAGWDGSARLWDAATGRELRCFEGHTNPVTSAAFSPKGHWILTTSWDGTTRFWNTETGTELARLASFRDGTWVVARPDGRFDTNNLEELKGLHWIMPDDPLRALPLEIFMRDYYEPRLLPRVLAGEKLPTIRSLTELNRAQPTVEIIGVERERDAQGRPGETVAVTVNVAGASETFGVEGQQRRMETGAYDLRLFRDGQLVGQAPQEGSQATVGLSAQEELTHWRQERLVVDLKEGARQLVFKGIRLPRRAGVTDVQFSAYAFNEDRVKSETARMSFVIPVDLSPRVPRAYLVTVGVNAFADDRWDLSYAANDAQQLGGELKGRLEAVRDDNSQPRYEQVVWVKLTAEAHVDHEGTRQMTKIQASKAQIEAVLKTLAGQPVKAEALQGIEQAAQLRRANPEDLVILALSTHGEVDERGRFYLLPHDIGVNPTEQERRTRAISNDELSAWLQGLDAIDLVMIVDACHSAASVQSQEFKPGPMGSRGLGQLAYDKGMRILTATQIDQYALETQKTQLGLLSYALVREGLEQDKADYKPKDEQIWLSEWLSYAAERVPGLYRDWKDGTLKGRKKGELLDAPEVHLGDSPALQQPALFDFARNRDALIGSGVR